MLKSCVMSCSSAMSADRLGHRLRQADIVRNHRAIPRGSDVPQGQPHFEGTEAARVLRAVVDIVRRTLLEMIVGRVVREGGAQRLRIAHQRASGLERRIEPLVRIDRDGIGQAQPAQIIGRVGNAAAASHRRLHPRETTRRAPCRARRCPAADRRRPC